MAKKHPDKDIKKAIKYAESKGWTVISSDGHAWGKLKCPYNDSECRGGMYCLVSVYSTPRNPTTHAKQIIKVVDGCNGKSQEDKEINNEDE